MNNKTVDEFRKGIAKILKKYPDLVINPTLSTNDVIERIIDWFRVNRRDMTLKEFREVLS